MKFPHNLTHSALELYTKDPVEFEARYIYGLKKKSPYKNFAKRLEIVSDDLYDESIFWGYQRKRVVEALGDIKPLNMSVTAMFAGHEIAERIDYMYDNTVVCFTMYTPPTQKQMLSLESLRLILCGYCAEQHYQNPIEQLEYWHLKGYKDIINKVVYPRTLMDEVLALLKEKLMVDFKP